MEMLLCEIGNHGWGKVQNSLGGTVWVEKCFPFEGKVISCNIYHNLPEMAMEAFKPANTATADQCQRSPALECRKSITFWFVHWGPQVQAENPLSYCWCLIWTKGSWTGATDVSAVFCPDIPALLRFVACGADLDGKGRREGPFPFDGGIFWCCR